MKRGWRILMVLVLMGMAVLSAIGCGSTKNSLVVVTMFSGDDNHTSTFTSINKEYSEKYDFSITDKSGNATGEGWQNTVVDLVNGKNSPDVVFFFSGAAIEPMKANLIKLADIKAEDADYGKNIVMDAGDDYGLAIKAGSQAIMYNSDYYEATDFATKASLMAAIADADKTPAVSGDLPHYWLNHFMAYYLGYTEYAAMNGTKAYFTEAKIDLWAEALKNTLNDMRTIGFKAQAENKNGNEATAFWEGTRSIAIDGQWTASSVNAAAVKDKLKFVNFPKADGATKDFYIGGVTTGWYITKSAWNNANKRQKAIDYVKMHTTDEALNKYCVAGGGAPANGKDLTGASVGVAGFASVAKNAEMLVAIDDRIPTAAKTVLMGNWDTSSGAPKLLAQAADVTLAEAKTLWQAVVAKLN